MNGEIHNAYNLYNLYNITYIVIIVPKYNFTKETDDS